MIDRLLSVCLITYNHEKYIRQAIDGILMQKVNFPWELIIADDCSTDGTTDIVKEYKKQYPNFIHLILQEKNVGPAKNWIDLITTPKSKYIAYFEGDDYWTDPLKLQKQVDFLEGNKEFVLCHHSVDVLFPDGTIVKDYITKGKMDKSDSNIYDLATLGNYIHTPSVVFKNVIVEFPPSFQNALIGDFFLYMLLAQHGNIKKLDDNMATYRFGVGSHSSQNATKRSNDFQKTLAFISESIPDKTVSEILKFRLNSSFRYSLPKGIREEEDLGLINKPEKLIKYVSAADLIKALWKKLMLRALFRI